MKTCTYCGKQYLDEASVCAIDGYPLQPVAPAQGVAPVSQKHSGLGIVSFSMSIGVGFLMLVVFVVAGLLSAGRVHHGQTYPGQMAIGFAAIFLLGLDVIAVGLGIAAVCQKDRKRLFGILGLVFSAATVLGTIGLMIIGLMFAARVAH